ncbi:hypothetical protein F4556_005175 [Kitasatospora gansuensis]|uniref:Uncharacterized protein n=1 Tax=Kitasatospora gansuensis TaxID=258050 RepID=A0A7W7SFQ6_9ACTN|nr:hypothetical protein [Kitasatospora gansuensis]MBB4949640.1 hypothetical protein [Kitasatospora gansuensis]
MSPNVPQDLLDQIRKMDDRLRMVEGRAQIRPALSQILGDVTIGEGGRLIVKTPGGQTILYIGRIDPDHPDGSDQQGLIVRREDGTVAISVWTSAGSGVQPVVIWDHNGKGIFAEDLVGGGLAAPNFGSDAWYGVTEAPAWTTSSTSFVTCMSLPWKKWHPRVQGSYLARCSDASTSGEIRLVDGSGSVIGQATLAAGAYTVSSVTGSVTGTLGGDQFLTWQARVTAGPGTVGVRGLSTWGVQS